MSSNNLRIGALIASMLALSAMLLSCAPQGTGSSEAASATPSPRWQPDGSELVSVDTSITVTYLDSISPESVRAPNLEGTDDPITNTTVLLVPLLARDLPNREDYAIPGRVTFYTETLPQDGLMFDPQGSLAPRTSYFGIIRGLQSLSGADLPPIELKFTTYPMSPHNPDFPIVENTSIDFGAYSVDPQKEIIITFDLQDWGMLTAKGESGGGMSSCV